MIKIRIWYSLNLIFLLGLYGCAHVTASNSDTILLIGNVESLDLRTLKERSRISPNGDVWITNACGKADITFDVKASTQNIGSIFSTQQPIGEWCRPPYNFQGLYLLAVKDKEILYSSRVFHTEENLAVIHIDQDDLNYLKGLSGLVSENIIIEDFPDVVIHPDNLHPKNPDIISWVKDSEALKIQKIEEEDFVVITRGIILERIFPNLVTN